MVMKIDNYEGASDEFQWPQNPQVYDDLIDSNYSITNLSYQRHHIVVSGGGISPKVIILTGHFTGTNKLVDYRSLARHFQESQKLKKLYFESDKFALGIGKQSKKTHQGGRTNFIDYVATYQTILGIFLDDTQQTHTDGGAHKTNAGDVATFIETISGNVTSGSTDITVSDSLGNAYLIPKASLTTGQAVVISFVSMIDSGSGVFVSTYNYTTVAGSQIKTLQVTAGFGMIQLAAARTTSDLTIVNLDGYTVKFRNGWSA